MADINPQDQFSKKATEQSAKLTQDARTLKEEYKDLLGIKSKLNDYDREAINLSDKVAQSAKDNVVELGRTGELNKQILKDRKLLLDLDRELLISSRGLTSEQKTQAEQLANFSSQRLSILDQIEDIQQNLVNLDEVQQSLGLSELQTLQDQLAVLESQTDLVLDQTDLDTQRLALAIQTKNQQESNLKLKQQESNIQDQINKKLGIAGNTLSFASGILGDAAKGFGLDKVAEDMKNFAEESIRAGKEVSKLQVLSRGIQSAFGNLGKSLTDPTVVIGAMIKGFNHVDKAQKEFRQVTGQNVDAFDTLNGEITTSSEYIKAASELSKELGVNASVVFSKETIVEVAELTDNMGMAAKEAANLAKLSKASGTELKENAHSIEHGFKEFVKTNKTALNFGQVMGDVGKASSALTISLGSNPERIAEAAMEARKLGLSLEQVDKIADSLLDFEQSISNELEAELLTGKDLNLEKARSAALNNDIATLSKEIGKNQEVTAAFASGNRIQQEAIAKSLGMSREDMANMLYQQKLSSGLSSEQAAKAANISLEEAKRLTTQEQINKATEKLTELLGLVLEPILAIVSNKAALYTTFSVIALALLPKMVSGMKGFASSLKDGLSSAKDLGKSLMGGKGGDVLDKIGGGADDLSKKTKGMSPQAGKGIKDFMVNLGKGLEALASSFKAIGPAGFAYLALGLGLITVAAIGLGYALKLAAPAIEAIGEALKSILEGVGAVIKDFAEGFSMILKEITMEKAIAMGILGLSFFTLAGGLLAFSLALAGAGVISFFSGDGVMDQLKELAEMADPLKTTADSLVEMAKGLFGIGEALNTIDTDKLEELGDFALDNSLANIGNSIAGAIGSIFGSSSSKEDPQAKELAEIKSIMQAILNKNYDIYLDSTKVGTGMAIGTSKVQ
jgi:hypothetical protein